MNPRFCAKIKGFHCWLPPNFSQKLRDRNEPFLSRAAFERCSQPPLPTGRRRACSLHRMNMPGDSYAPRCAITHSHNIHGHVSRKPRLSNGVRYRMFETSLFLGNTPGILSDNREVSETCQFTGVIFLLTTSCSSCNDGLSG